MPPARKSSVSARERSSTCGFPAPALMITGMAALKRAPRALWSSLVLLQLFVCLVPDVLDYARGDDVIETLVSVHRSHSRDPDGNAGPDGLDQHEQLLRTEARAPRIVAHLTECR